MTIRFWQLTFFPKAYLSSSTLQPLTKTTLALLKRTGNERVLLHIYLDEKDAREEEWHDLKPNGFTESRQVNDFPIRDHKVVLHVRRRRWLTAEGRNIILDRYSLLADNTSYSKEFADVLKKIFGYLPDNGPLAGAILYGRWQ